MPDKDLHNQIRNILMNEMGLSREAIRSEMEKIVYEVLSKRIESLLEGHRLRQMVREIILEQFQGRPGVMNKKNSLKDLILTTAKEEAANLIHQNVAITVANQSINRTG